MLAEPFEFIQLNKSVIFCINLRIVLRWFAERIKIEHEHLALNHENVEI